LSIGADSSAPFFFQEIISMGDTVTQKNIGGMVVSLQSVDPVASAAATINGTTIDRQAHSMPLSALMHTQTGAETGAPTSVTVQSTLQDSADGTNWANYLPDGVNPAQGAAITAISADQNFSVDLTLARRFLRIVTVIAFVGGTTPTIGVAAELVLGGEQTLAAV
jgi:hypothetical protein